MLVNEEQVSWCDGTYIRSFDCANGKGYYMMYYVNADGVTVDARMRDI